MKYRLALTLLAFVLSTVWSRAAEPKLHLPVPITPEGLTGTNAEEDWQQLLAVWNDGNRSLPTDEIERAAAQHHHRLKQLPLLVAYYEKYSEAPERWQAVLAMGSLTNDLINEDGSPKVAVGGEWPASAWVKWRMELQSIRALGVTAADTPQWPRFRFEVDLPGGLVERLAAIRQAQKEGTPLDLDALWMTIDGLAMKYPDQPSLGGVAKSYMQFRATTGASPMQLKSEWQSLGENANEHIRAVAKQALVQLEAVSKPLEIAFTAVDGTQVDLKQLRGKVVLIDFWATWCGPCIAELPNVKQVYADYHDKGFEIVGIALENARLATSDTTEQAAEKLAKAKKVLTAFTAKNDMPWPQYFDGKFWKNDISTAYAINAIPAMFLVDQNGMVVSTNARGEKLETEVKRLLGM